MTEDVEKYQELGEQATPQKRKQAAIAAHAFLFGTDWTIGKTISFLSPATDRLLAFAGEDIANEVSHEMDIMNLPDAVSAELVEHGINQLHQAFDFDSMPHRRKYWNEVIRNARMASGGLTSE